MILLLSVRLLDGRYHGLTANGERPEWPPSPFRLFQAILAGNARGITLPTEVSGALRWLEALNPPEIIAPLSSNGQTLLTYVLNNSEGRSRAPKIIRPTVLNSDRLIQYAWTFDADAENAIRHAETVSQAARHIRALGWGIDMAIGDGELIDSTPAPIPSRIRYAPVTDNRGADVRTPRVGSLESLKECYSQYLGRFESNETTFLESGGPIYHLQPYIAGKSRPYAVFRIDCDDELRRFNYPQSKLIHIAGMVKHLAIERMKRNPPPERELRGIAPVEWIRAYVSGHQSKDDKDAGLPHAQFSYIPLQSVSAHVERTDPGVRRVMIVAPIGDDEWLEHLARQLDGQPLKPLPNTALPPGTRLERIDDKKKDGVRDAYTRASRVWASVTPVILPGHDDHKPDKARKLIEKALQQSGIEQPCEFEWSAFSHFRKMLGAHKYVKDDSAKDGKRRINYIRPDHLLEQTAVHLKIRFGRREDPNDENSRWFPAEPPVPGPITLGAGRHCGFGLMAAVDD